jgi:predicted small secreted protein
MLIRLMALAILVGFLGGCNTMEGAGRDIEQGGQKLQDESREHR